MFFSSDTLHEVCPVHPETEAFRDNRFAVTMWFHGRAWPPTLAGTGAAPGQGGTDHLLRRATLMRKREIDLVLDVGANKGQFGLSLRNQIGYRGRIVSFEPLSEAFAELRRIAARDVAWSCHNLALGDETGSATINISANSHSSSLLPVSEHTLEIEPSVAYLGHETVKFRHWSAYPR